MATLTAKVVQNPTTKKPAPGTRKHARLADVFGKNVSIDENVVAKLPAGSQIVSVTPGGPSLWVQTAVIEFRLPDQTIVQYFKKGASGDGGRKMVEGSFEGEKALHTFMPEHVPKPIAWGVHKSIPDTYFYLCEFVDMVDDVPDKRKWAGTVAKLHKRSSGKSPGGKFGFQVATHLANVPIDNSWSDSWESFWAQQLSSMFQREEALRGPNDELSRLKTAYFEKVIPRLLRPLETEGRHVTPCLIHSDLWPGNIMHRRDNDELCMFDSCAYWGHHEADLGICWNPRYKLGPPTRDAYLHFMPMSHPREDFEDRNALYAMKFHVLLSILYSDDALYRDILIQRMRELVDKFPDGYAGYEAKRKQRGKPGKSRVDSTKSEDKRPQDIETEKKPERLMHPLLLKFGALSPAMLLAIALAIVAVAVLQSSSLIFKRSASAQT